MGAVQAYSEVVFERFTDRARRVLVLAQDEARLLNHNFIGPEHILLGLLHDGEGVAAQVLAEFDVTLDATRQRVEEIIGHGETPAPGSPPFTPRAKNVLELANRESLQFDHDHIGPEHLLLGVMTKATASVPRCSSSSAWTSSPSDVMSSNKSVPTPTRLRQRRTVLAQHLLRASGIERGRKDGWDTFSPLLIPSPPGSSLQPPRDHSSRLRTFLE